MTPTTFPSLALQKNQATLMVNKLPTNDNGGDTFMLKTSFQKGIYSVQGSFESLDALATANPPYSMRSYFTYLAQRQFTSVGGNVTYSNKYASVFQDRNAITPTYPGMYPKSRGLRIQKYFEHLHMIHIVPEYDSTYVG